MTCCLSAPVGRGWTSHPGCPPSPENHITLFIFLITCHSLWWFPRGRGLACLIHNWVHHSLNKYLWRTRLYTRHQGNWDRHTVAALCTGTSSRENGWGQCQSNKTIFLIRKNVQQQSDWESVPRDTRSLTEPARGVRRRVRRTFPVGQTVRGGCGQHGEPLVQGSSEWLLGEVGRNRGAQCPGNLKAVM